VKCADTHRTEVAQSRHRGACTLTNAEPDGRSEELGMLRIRSYLTRRRLAGALDGRTNRMRQRRRVLIVMCILAALFLVAWLPIWHCAVGSWVPPTPQCYSLWTLSSEN